MEVVATNTDDMVEEGLRLIKFGENVIVKVPMTADGLMAVRKAERKGNQDKRNFDSFIK